MENISEYHWGKEIRAMMRAVGLTQMDLALDIGISHQTVWRYWKLPRKPRTDEADKAQRWLSRMYKEGYQPDFGEDNDGQA